MPKNTLSTPLAPLIANFNVFAAGNNAFKTISDMSS